MTGSIIQPQRVFQLGSVSLPDPDAEMTPEEVCALYATNYPQLAQAMVSDCEVSDDGMTITYRFLPPQAKTKG